MRLADAIEHLKTIPVGKWHVYEKVVCHYLGLKAKQGMSACSQLTEILAALRKGYKGNKQLKTFKATGDPGMDLGDIGTHNQFDIHYSLHGTKESFPPRRTTELL